MPRRKTDVPQLAVYAKKRDFSKTAEPPGHGSETKGGSAYLIQKHAARRLHYDFRLELDGALKSWAVTRGPSLNPADKRLAVHVEDHPLEYATFEGTIPQGQYGGGTVMLWDRGSWEPIGDARKGYEKGRLTFILHGERLKGEWHLVRMGGRASEGKHDNWLLIKSRDRYADERNGDSALERYQTSVASGGRMEAIAKSGKPWISKPATVRTPKAVIKNRPRRKRSAAAGKSRLPPAFVAPQLATLVSRPPDSDDWVHEIKFDGYRALCRIEDGTVQLLTRANNDWTGKFGDIAACMRELPVDNALLDGEIVTIAEDGTMSFHALQQTMGKGQKQKLHYYLFDLLFLDGRDFRNESLLRRKQALQKLIPPHHPCVHYSEHFNDPGTDVLEHACHIALEGIVSKQTDAPYHSGRSDAWLKSKCINEQEFVIGGFTCQPKHPGHLAALLIGYYKGGDLAFAGKTGTGFSREEAEKLVKKFLPLKRSGSPFRSVPASERRGAIWLEPKLVGQIAFTEWTEGGSLRHPSFQGLREDKPADQVVREKKKNLPLRSSSPHAHETQRPDMPTKKKARASIEGVSLTHPDKVLYGEQGITKLDVAEYYGRVADYMLPHVTGRPISLMRCPEGTGNACFFQRHGGEGLSEHIRTVKIESDNQPYLAIDNVSGLIALVQMGVLEIHVWGARADRPDRPDRIVFDFDPGEGVPWRKVKSAAEEARQRLKDIKLAGFPKVTGGKGLHVVVPIERRYDWNTVKIFAKTLAEFMARDTPQLYTVNSRKIERQGRIFIDYLRNDKTASSIAPYSTRARPGAPVAVPVGWDELAALSSANSFTMPSVIQRLEKSKNNPWKNMATLHQLLPA